MTQKIQDEKPCLVETPQGFSVFYRNKFLYSKYAPQRAVCTAIQNLTVLPGTLFLCCSPVLPYGIEELIAKLDEKSFCLLCDFDSELSDFSRTQFEAASKSKLKNTARLSLNELQNLPVILNEPSYTTAEGIELLPAGSFKRVVRIDFSAGTQFHPELYEQLTAACTNAIMTFWANRITLTKFGRRYSQDFFKNLKLLSSTTPVTKFFDSVTKPIIVFGAGESTDRGILEIKNNASDYFILCADTALQPLLDSGIEPDGVFVEEAQNIIKKAFVGCQNTRTQIFAGLSCVPHLNRIKQPQKLSFFTTKYVHAQFLETLLQNEIIPPANEPFGSVGLTAVYYALNFRKSEDIPVYIYGLDFSYSAGITHARGTLSHRQRLLSQKRYTMLSNYEASFGQLSQKITGKDGRVFYSTRTLMNYAALFNGYFQGIKNLFDASDSGIPLSIQRKKPEPQSTGTSSDTADQLTSATFTKKQADKIINFLESEKQTLEKLRDVLSGKLPLPPDEQKDYIIKTASCREYLFLHFADGISFRYETSFLKRIRTEIDFFLKIF